MTVGLEGSHLLDACNIVALLRRKSKQKWRVAFHARIRPAKLGIKANTKTKAKRKAKAEARATLMNADNAATANRRRAHCLASDFVFVFVFAPPPSRPLPRLNGSHKVQADAVEEVRLLEVYRVAALGEHHEAGVWNVSLHE